MKSNIIKITGQSGTGKSGIAHFFLGMLETAGYTVTVVDGRRPKAEDCKSDFVFWTVITKSETPQITFMDWHGLNDFQNALCHFKEKGSVGKVRQLMGKGDKTQR